MSCSGFGQLERGLAARTASQASSILRSITKQRQQAQFIGWPELADSFQRDELQLQAHMRAKGWLPPDTSMPERATAAASAATLRAS